MARLYWRVKNEDGNWTWTPAQIDAWSEESIMLLRRNQTKIDGTQIFHLEEEEWLCVKNVLMILFLTVAYARKSDGSINFEWKVKKNDYILVLYL